MSDGRLAARAVIGGLFIGHGTQKLLGWFGGPGRGGTEGMMEALEMRPARLHAAAAGVTETAGGALLAAGLATPLAAARFTGLMTTAIKKVHVPSPWAANGGWEYNAIMIAAVIALADTGPHAVSLDHALGIERSGPPRGAGRLSLGVGGVVLTMAAGRRGRPAAVPAGDGTAAAAAEGDTAGDRATRGT